MHKPLLAFAILGATALATPALAGPNDVELFGKDPGTSRAAACFIRHYDDAHLASHPQQNVTDMTVLVDGATSDGERTYMVALGVNFRGVPNPMEASSYCGMSLDGESILDCAIDCDGGQIGVDMKDGAMMVSIPFGARTWDPANPDAEPGSEPAEAAFGDDDKLFKLTRTDLSECIGLAYDDELKALLVSK